jgi:hypothetical protein
MGLFRLRQGDLARHGFHAHSQPGPLSRVIVTVPVSILPCGYVEAAEVDPDVGKLSRRHAWLFAWASHRMFMSPGSRRCAMYAQVATG